MTTISLGNPAYTIPPLSNISPFTYRDGITYTELLYALRDYVTGTVVDDFNTEMSRIIDDFNTGLTGATTGFEDAKTDWNTRFDALMADLSGQVTLINDAGVAGMVNDALTTTGAALRTLINTSIDGKFNNTAVAGMVTTAGATRTALDGVVSAATNPKVSKGELMLNVKDYGAKGDGTTDDTAAIQAAITAATPGTTIYFPPAPSSYKIPAGLLVDKPNIRFYAGSRDYGASIKCTTPGATMITVKETQFILDGLTLIGDGTSGGIGASVNGIDLYGDRSGNVDSTIGGTFIYLNVCVRSRGRNSTVKDALLSNSLAGVVWDGTDPTYHTTAPANGDKRGNVVTQTRFHDIADKGIELTPTACVISGIIENNFFDSGSPTRPIYAVGTAALPHRKIAIRNNKATELTADALTLTWVQNSTVRGLDLAGWGVGDGGRGIVLDQCTDIDIADITMLQLGRTGVVSTNGTRVRLDNVKARAIGYDAATVADGFTFNTTNTGCEFTNLSVEGTDGWGFNGDPAASSLNDSRFSGCTLGNINSTTVHQRSTAGRNAFIEGTGGRKQDYASKSFDPVDGVGFSVAGITPANGYTSYELEVVVVGRTTAGPLYYRGLRYVRPENGSQIVTTIGTDATAGTVVVNYTPSGTGIAISCQVTGAGALCTIHVTARAGAGNVTGAARAVTVAMA